MSSRAFSRRAAKSTVQETAVCARRAHLRKQAGIAWEWLAGIRLVFLPVGSQRGGQCGVGQHLAVLAEAEMRQRHRRLLADLHVRQVVVPNLLGLLALGEEQQVRLHARARRRETRRPAG